MHWIYLSLAIVAEVVGTSVLKQSDGFSRLGLGALSVVSFGVALFFLSLALRAIPLGIAYAIWAGVGIVIISLIGVVVFRQGLDAPAILGIALILGGVVVINVFSNTAVH
ncbi:multidrug efflux SMR transporter [Pelagibius sp.]|uniref:DMT family transporter n=1 Tax=Pelagibius sp. TaxID=1931238 RepID=UPI00260EE3F8|nr:multidrug efflux SMR transporter [Pelagibius sp.]